MCAASFNTFWYLFIKTFLWQIWIIWYFKRRISRCTYRYTSDKCDSFGWIWLLWGGWIMILNTCIVLISLHWQPMWIMIHLTCELQLPASTKGFMWVGGWGDLYFVYRRIYGELLLIFVLYFNCHLNQKRIFKRRFFLPPPQIVFESSINGIFIWFFFFFFALHNSQAVYFLINQTSMMLYYCMHFNFFFQVKKKAWICQSF